LLEPAPGSAFPAAARAPSDMAAPLCGILVAAGAWSAEAQTYRLDGLPAPPEYSLDVYYMFHVYGAEAPTPSRPAGSVEFRTLSFKPSGVAEPPRGHQSLEVALLPADSLPALAGRKVCGPKGQLMREQVRAVAVLGVPRAGESASPPRSQTFTVPETGKYALAVSNCGGYSAATISGRVSVKSAHGHLPGNQLNTMYASGCFAVLYAVIFLVWLVSMACNAGAGLFYVHHDIAAACGLCVAEGISSWVEDRDWNATGDRSNLLGAISVVSSALKCVFLWRAVLMPSLGAGVVRESAGGRSEFAFCALSAFFLAQGCVSRSVFSRRFDLALEEPFLATVALPGVAAAAVIYAWTFKALSGFIRSLRERKSTELLGVFEEMRVVFLAGAALSAMVAVMQLAFLGTEFPWERQWILDQAVPQLGFMAVLLAMMHVWWPSESMAWNSSYLTQANDDEADPVKMDTGTVVSPEPIGAVDN